MEKYKASDLSYIDAADVMINLAYHVPELFHVLNDAQVILEALRAIREKGGPDSVPSHLFPFPFRLYSQYITSRVSTPEKKEHDLNVFISKLKEAREWINRVPSDDELLEMKRASEIKAEAEKQRIRDVQAAAKIKYEKIDQLREAEAEFISEITTGTPQHIAVMLYDGVSKDNIRLINDVNKIFLEVDGKENWLKVMEFLERNNFDVQKLIDKYMTTNLGTLEAASKSEKLIDELKKLLKTKR